MDMAEDELERQVIDYKSKWYYVPWWNKTLKNKLRRTTRKNCLRNQKKKMAFGWLSQIPNWISQRNKKGLTKHVDLQSMENPHGNDPAIFLFSHTKFSYAWEQLVFLCI